jgi:hypothetical protein
VAGGLEVGQGGLRAEEVALHVQVEHFVVELFRRVLEWLSAGHSGVVHQDVQASERCGCLIDDALALRHEAQVSLQGDGLSTCRCDLGHGGVGALPAGSVVQRDARPFARQFARDPLTNSNTRAGDERRTSLEMPHPGSTLSLRCLLARRQ